MFSYISAERRVAADPGHGGHGAERAIAVVWTDISGLGPAIDRAGKAAAGAAVAAPVFDSQREAVDGTARIQPVVPLVRGAEHRRTGVGANGVQQESRPAAAGRDRREVLRPGARSGAREQSAVG